MVNSVLGLSSSFLLWWRFEFKILQKIQNWETCRLCFINYIMYKFRAKKSWDERNFWVIQRIDSVVQIARWFLRWDFWFWPQNSLIQNHKTMKLKIYKHKDDGTIYPSNSTSTCDTDTIFIAIETAARCCYVYILVIFNGGCN